MAQEDPTALPTDATDARIMIALVQMTACKSVEDNLAFLVSHIEEAAERGARYVLTPENSLLMDLDAERVHKIAASETYAQAFDALYSLARRLNIWLHIGATPVVVDDALKKASNAADEGPLLVNRSFVIGPDGQMRDFYDKIHMFDVQLPDGEHYCESANFRPGDRAVVVGTDFARLGLSVCYDLRFPGLFRQLAQAGADILTVPAAFTAYTGRAHWEVLLRARAIETGCFVIAAAQTGDHETGRSTYGHSLVAAPWGDVLLDAGDQPGVFMAELDLQLLYEARSKVPSLRHDRPFHMVAPL